MIDILSISQNYAPIFEVLPAFFLTFILVFAVLEKTMKMKKNQAAMLAFIMGAITIAPHFAGTSQYDPVVIINTLGPTAGFLGITVILLIFGIGLFTSNKGLPIGIFILFIAVLVYVFGSSVGWWNMDATNPASDYIAPAIAVLTFIIISWFILGRFIGSQTAN